MKKISETCETTVYYETDTSVEKIIEVFLSSKLFKETGYKDRLTSVDYESFYVEAYCQKTGKTKIMLFGTRMNCAVMSSLLTISENLIKFAEYKE